jgi:16S rRNA (adenine1518-N6/adenine1519-N6)-dimethyltransferase
MNHIRPRKRFGQNFLTDRNIIDKIITCLGPGDTDHFVEIGPGKGAISQALNAAAGQLDVIEIDRDLVTDLESQPWASEINIHSADALKFPFDELVTNQEKLRLVGNLPYNISTPLLFHVLDYRNLFTDIHVMLQKEVVERMTAPPGSRTYGRLSVMLAATCEVTKLFEIRPGSFSPAPRVDSAFARLEPLEKPHVTATDTPALRKIVTAAFGQRRKQISNALRDFLSPEELIQAGVDPTSRAEQLTIDNFVSLMQQWQRSG